jgi:hypothetical protein
MSITIKGVTSGGVDLKAPDTGTNTTVTLPSATGTLLPTDGDGSGLTNLTSANLVGALPAISGASLTGLPAGGVDGITSASSSGTAISIASNNNVGVGIITPTMHTGTGMQLHSSGSDCRFHISNNTVGGGVDDGAYLFMGSDGTFAIMQMESADIRFISGGGTVLDITSSGRGKSQFTAGCWCSYDDSTGIKDSHNISSVGDWGTGNYGFYIASGFSNTNYVVVGTTHDQRNLSLDTGNTHPQGGRFDVQINNVDSGHASEDVNYCYVLAFGDM